MSVYTTLCVSRPVVFAAITALLHTATDEELAEILFGLWGEERCNNFVITADGEDDGQVALGTGREP